MRTIGRLIKKTSAILLIKLTDKLQIGKSYNIIFPEINKTTICEDQILYKLNEEYFYIKFPTKLKGFLKLEYQKDYTIEINEGIK